MAIINKTGGLGYNMTSQMAVIMRNLNHELQNIKKGTQAGLIEAMIHIRRETETTAPITPVDTGNLRASWFSVTAKGRIPDPIGRRNFKGDKKGIMQSEHSQLIAEAQSMTGGREPVAIGGYSANYAAPVHEMLGANFQRPNAGPHWLQAAINRNKDKLVQIVGNKAKIK